MCSIDRSLNVTVHLIWNILKEFVCVVCVCHRRDTILHCCDSFSKAFATLSRNVYEKRHRSIYIKFNQSKKIFSVHELSTRERERERNSPERSNIKKSERLCVESLIVLFIFYNRFGYNNIFLFVCVLSFAILYITSAFLTVSNEWATVDWICVCENFFFFSFTFFIQWWKYADNEK